MDASFYFDRLFPFQDAVLAAISELDSGLYLTGGTAASRGNLGHRFDDDLGLFANDAPGFVPWADRVLDARRRRNEWRCGVLTREARVVRAVLEHDGVALKVELVNDVPSRVGAVVEHPVLGRLDSAENILANKITTVLNRSTPRPDVGPVP